MMMMNLSNISLDMIRAFLLKKDFQCGSWREGHEVWVRKGMVRPVILRTGFDPVPEFVVRNMLRVVQVDGEELEAFLTGENELTDMDKL